MSKASDSRARSVSQASSARRNQKFMTKWKLRSGNQSVLENSNGAADLAPMRTKGSAPERKSRSFLFPNSCSTREDFNKTSQNIKNFNFRHHHPDLCVCKDCSCGRHLCEFHNVKPDMAKNTIYKLDFLKKKPIPNKVNISHEYDRLNGPHLDMDSIYNHQLPNHQPGKVQKPIPQDLLKTGGPCPNLTSYSSGFPGFRGVNQYVKPTDRHTRGEFPLRSKSTYTRSFIGDPPKKDDYQRIPDSLKTGSNWFGESHYSQKFRQPNPEDYAKIRRIIQTKEENPDYCHQYETVYRKSFLGQQKPICPAKVALETKSKGFFAKSKSNFSQNADFKALQPEYHAISTSKHWYV